MVDHGIRPFLPLIAYLMFIIYRTMFDLVRKCLQLWWQKYIGSVRTWARIYHLECLVYGIGGEYDWHVEYSLTDWLEVAVRMPDNVMTWFVYFLPNTIIARGQLDALGPIKNYVRLLLLFMA